ncbi:hypothetical protein BO78DRAFT_142090 [Aspergillus sclerotiicarbonarius CBS 121057]|uniref:Transmembrane protein n=1 Tax=Aspergillus sclerotiicarbonarius (strain CBS 121057 / IBT 28362) TaxID=1448318 RepID=A0A319E8R9_ASPSB|nr:hypothetical protein BO78DRAFT_142090 [Aspergillus sclerotiicarbonarius CBS 121057]
MPSPDLDASSHGLLTDFFPDPCTLFCPLDVFGPRHDALFQPNPCFLPSPRQSLSQHPRRHPFFFSFCLYSIVIILCCFLLLSFRIAWVIDLCWTAFGSVLSNYALHVISRSCHVIPLFARFVPRPT